MLALSPRGCVSAGGTLSLSCLGSQRCKEVGDYTLSVRWGQGSSALKEGPLSSSHRKVGHHQAEPTRCDTWQRDTNVSGLLSRDGEQHWPHLASRSGLGPSCPSSSQVCHRLGAPGAAECRDGGCVPSLPGPSPATPSQCCAELTRRLCSDRCVLWASRHLGLGRLCSVCEAACPLPGLPRACELPVPMPWSGGVTH